MKLGATEISKIYLGSQEVTKAYLGSVQVHGSSSPVVPYDAEIEYLQNTGTQYIDTGLTLSSGTTKITTKFKIVFTSIPSGSRMICLSTPNSGIQVYTSGGNKIFNQGAYEIVSANTLYTVTTNTTSTNRNITVNGNTNGVNFNRSVTDGAAIDCCGSRNTNILPAYAKYYYFKIYRNDVPVRDYIPVRVGQVGYMYDRVSGTLFGNSGSDSFILGPDKQ